MTADGRFDTPSLRGQHVYLRAPERSDIPLFVRWLNDAETTAYLAMRAPMSIAMEERWFEKAVDMQGEGRYHFTICLLDSGQPVGNCGLFEVDLVSGSAGIGIVIGEKELWSKGLGTDAMNALLDFGFGQLRLERLWLDVYDFNPRGRRSYEKAGFVLEGTHRRAIYKRGAFRDVTRMAILRDEWQALDRPRSWDFDAAPN